ncbi:unnamed protein product [Paramecium sonneborni]|uniref:Transmembrane protein n=1 Tax=Paramecium sonneborni TaxID=65129 RepID=A0A8S1QAG1_9CILI|nr:unnamed protein product [Paramecium sonneborni]
MNILRNADFFGVPFVQSIDQKQTTYKSVLGGILTLTIFAASLAYAIWVIYLWQTKQMNPKISNSKYVSDYTLLDLNQDVLKVYYWKYDDNLIDPFQNNILLPLVIYTKKNKLTTPQLIENYTTSPYGNLYIPKTELGFSYIDGDIYTSEEMYIQIVLCSEIYLKPNQTCASTELIQKFFSQSYNIIGIQIYTKTLDSRDGSEQSGLQEFYIQIEQKYCYTMNTFLETNLYELQDYFLFGKSNYKEYITGALVQTQTSTFEYCQKAFQSDALSIIYIGMKGSQMKTIFEYPRAGDILANIGSIVSLLFMIKYIIIVLNQYSLNQKVLQELINFYYPEFKKICIKKNWRNQIIKINFNQVEVDTNEYKRFYQKVSRQMQQKLSFLNLLYEISRLYLIIRSLKYREELLKSHEVGIKINLTQAKESDALFGQKSSCSVKSYQDNFLLNEDDVDLLSLARRKTEKNYENIPEEIYNEIDFYNTNKII